MSLRTRRAFVIQAALAIAALILLAAGIAQLHFEPGQSLGLLALLANLRPPAPGPLPFDGQATQVPLWVRGLFWAALLVTVVHAIFSPQGRKQLIRMILIVAAILFIADRLLQEITPRSAEEGASALGFQGEGLGEQAHFPEPPPFVTDPPSWLFWAFNIALILVVAGIGWFIWARLRAREEDDTQDRIVQEAEEALAALEAGGDVRDVVLRCYVQMSQVLRESRHVERRKAMTPREFEQYLAAAGLRDEHIQRLTRLFESVRYGGKPSTGAAALEANDCLRAIVRAYGTQP
ncbi:MAG: DUF4129 domain-containing protein [Caldilineae bacterium]|nr:MAG: DUF4129 domain-containing protein [Caldilineae bacterium]